MSKSKIPKIPRWIFEILIGVLIFVIGLYANSILFPIDSLKENQAIQNQSMSQRIDNLNQIQKLQIDQIQTSINELKESVDSLNKNDSKIEKALLKLINDLKLDFDKYINLLSEINSLKSDFTAVQNELISFQNSAIHANSKYDSVLQILTNLEKLQYDNLDIDRDNSSLFTYQLVPDWFVDLKKDTTHLFAVGTAISNDRMLSIRKATMSARNDLSIQIRSLLIQKTKSLTENSEITKEDLYLSIIEKNVSANLLTKIKVNDQKIIRDNDKWRTFVYVAIPIIDIYKAFVNELSRNPKIFEKYKASDSLKELEKKIEEYNK